MHVRGWQPVIGLPERLSAVGGVVQARVAALPDRLCDECPAHGVGVVEGTDWLPGSSTVARLRDRLVAADEEAVGCRRIGHERVKIAADESALAAG